MHHTLSVLKKILLNILPKDKKQLSVFIVCLLISSLLWTLLKFSEEREDEVTVKLEFFNFPEDKMVVGAIPIDFSVKIKARGFDLLSQGIGLSEPVLKVDLSKTIILKKKDYYQHVWIPNNHQSEISAAFNSNLKSYTIVDDSIKLNLSPIVSKEVSTKFKFRIANQSDHYHIIPPLESPSRITVFGAQSVLRNLDTIYTETMEFSSLDQDLDEDFPLAKVPGINLMSVDSIRVFVGVEAIKRFDIEVPLEIRNLPDSLNVKLFPNTVKVSFVCGSNEYASIMPFDFKPFVDFKDLNNSFKTLNIELEDFPKKAKNVNIEPYSVEYILESKY